MQSEVMDCRASLSVNRAATFVIARPKAVAIHAGIPTDMDCRVASLLAVTKLKFIVHLLFRPPETGYSQ